MGIPLCAEVANALANTSCNYRRRLDSGVPHCQLAGARGARWLGIASGLWATPNDLREYRSKYGVHIPLSLDQSGALFRAFNVTQVPAALVTDGNGRIVRRIEPRDLETSAALREAVNATD